VDFAQWQDVYRPIYGAAADAELYEQQRQFRESGALSGHDELGKLYQRTIGRAARHSLGEYFTPAWLADFVLDRLGYRGCGTLLDPSAGLGVFLRCALDRGAEASAIAGYELNPLTAACASAHGLPVEVRDTLRDPGSQRFDVIAGNPPWVNWRYLNPAYRERIAPLWAEYGLVPPGGIRARLGAGMDDLSILFTYLCADRLLADGGRMGLLLSRTLLQSSGGGRGFRRFELPRGRYLKIAEVHEITGKLPFAGATNQTVAVICEVSGSRMVYPVAYFRGSQKWEAGPVLDDRGSPWAILRASARDDFMKLRGASPYSARVGVHTGGATGVYWVDVVERRPESVVIRNRGTAGRTDYPEVTAEIETTLVRTLVRGRDVSAWTVRPSCHIVLPHSSDGKPIPEAVMRERSPRTFAYFEQFRERMLERPHYRAHFQRQGLPYWSMYNVGPYTFTPYRAVWREQSTTFQCAVIEDPGLVADAKLVVVPCVSSDEAHYVAAMLNSTPAREFVASFRLRVQMSTHVLRHLRVPRFDPEDARHCQLAAMSRQSGALLAERMDEIVRDIWGLSGHVKIR
jgi:hypothetical protein